jgi:hypothetical protein
MLYEFSPRYLIFIKNMIVLVKDLLFFSLKELKNVIFFLIGIKPVNL